MDAAIRTPAMRTVFIALLLLLSASRALAQQTPYCTKVDERAADEATTLMSPKLLVQAIRYPQGGQLAGGAISGRGLQPRAALSFSPTDFYRGLEVRGAGRADCAAHEAARTFEASLQQSERARHGALRAQISYLEAHREQVHASLSKAAARFAEHAITLAELDDLRERVNALDRRLAQAQGEAQLAEAKQVTAPSPISSRQAARAYNQDSLRLAEAESRVRSGLPIQVQVTAGVIPLAPVDWYGMVELSVNLGGAVRRFGGDRYVKARTDELAHAPNEASSRLRQYRLELTALLAQAQSELSLVEQDLQMVSSMRQVLETSEAPNIAQQREKVAVAQISIEADRIFYQALVHGLSVELESTN